MNMAANMAAPPLGRTNPFPGLRPFREGEEHLFFGRESQVDAMVDTLAATRFLAVVGTSGSGKSSLVNCGLRPALHRGLMARAGTAWRMVDFRPGNDPLRALARALARDGVLFEDSELDGDLSLADMIRANLDMSKLGLIDIYHQARLGENVNLLVIADQFEELFRYRHLRTAHDEPAHAVPADATAFVNLLLEVREQTRGPIYVVLTMRSDFLGDCVQFPGLPEAINAGQYLVPRLTRDERRAAISAPVSVSGATISSVLLTRLVNDVGDNPDQLSILQHALNRTWARWQEKGGEGPLELAHYEAIGTMANALDRHAEDAYAELRNARQQQICQKLFKGLTDRATDPRGVRRPTKHGTLCALAGAAAAEVTEVVDVFREPSRSFLMPPAGEELSPDTVIDVSHESLMRVWERLRKWAEEEARSARQYVRLAETAMLYAEGRTGLSRDPELQLALEWREMEQPNPTWAGRYHAGFEQAVAFLEASAERRDKEAREQEDQRRRALEQAQALAEEQRQRAEAQARFAKLFAIGTIILFVFLIVACVGVLLSWVAEKQALKAKNDAIQRGSQFLGSEALSYLNDELDLALLLGTTASEHESFEARRALLTALESAPTVTAFLFGHTDSVQSVAFSPDGKLLASGSRDHTIRLWDIDKRAPAREPLVGYSDRPVSSIAFTPDGKTLASSSEDEILLWDVATGRPRGEPLSNQGQITGARTLVFGSDGKTLASTGDREIILWEAGTGQPRGKPLPLPSEVGTATLSPDGKIAAAYNFRDKKIYLWDVENRRPHGQPLSGPDAAPVLAFGPDGTTIAAGVDPAAGKTEPQATPASGLQKTIWLWDLATGQPLDRPFSSDQGGVIKLAFSPNGEILASITSSGAIQLWKVPDGTQRGQPLSSHRKCAVHSVALSPDGKSLASGCEDGLIILWNIGGGLPFGEPHPIPLSGSEVALSPDGSHLASARCGSRERSGCEIRLWNTNTGQSSGGPLTDPTGEVASLAFSPDGRTLAAGGCGKRERGGCTRGEIRLWDVNSGRSLGGPLAGPTANVSRLAVSRDGHTLAAGSCSKWDGPDCTQGEVRLWDVSTGQPAGGPLAFPMLNVGSLAVSPDGHTLATGGCGKREGPVCAESEIRLWDFRNQRLLGAPLPTHRAFVNSLAFSPDGGILASAGNDVILWDVLTRQQRGDSLKDLSAVRSLAFAPDGKILAAAGSGTDLSGDRGDVVVLWDLSTQRPLGPPLGHPGISSLAFGSDGRSLISVGFDYDTRKEDVEKWGLDVASWRGLACRIANRNLTVQEWRRYFPNEKYRKTCSDRAADPGLLREAVELARAGDLGKALARFRDIKRKFDESSDPAAEDRFVASALVERARELAKSGELDEAVADFRRAKGQDPDLTLDPEVEARRFRFSALVHEGQQFARQGEGQEAIAAFGRAAALNAGRTLSPQMKAAASVLRGQGQQLARDGRLDLAVRALGDANTLDPSSPLDPDATARRLRAEALVAEGRRLASGGQAEQAMRTFQEAKTLDPSLPLDPECEAQRLAAGAAAEGLVEKGQQLAIEGKVQEALAAYAEARKVDPAAVTALALNALCWNGSLAGHANAVMQSCEAAVAREPKDGEIRDSRGLARALTGNRQGAIEDFEFFIWAKKEPSDPGLRKREEERGRWIIDLAAGRNPFDANILQELRNE
jgi:WD40 repeat protein/tetratricopeptide (TPR) repeat protein